MNIVTVFWVVLKKAWEYNMKTILNTPFKLCHAPYYADGAISDKNDEAIVEAVYANKEEMQEIIRRVNNWDKAIELINRLQVTAQDSNMGVVLYSDVNKFLKEIGEQ